MCAKPAGLWRHPDFLRFWAGQSLSRVGTQITALALPTAAIQLLGAGLGMVAVVWVLAGPISIDGASTLVKRR